MPQKILASRFYWYITRTGSPSAQLKDTLCHFSSTASLPFITTAAFDLWGAYKTHYYCYGLRDMIIFLPASDAIIFWHRLRRGLAWIMRISHKMISGAFYAMGDCYTGWFLWRMIAAILSCRYFYAVSMFISGFKAFASLMDDSAPWRLAGRAAPLWA